MSLMLSYKNAQLMAIQKLPCILAKKKCSQKWLLAWIVQLKMSFHCQFG